jgi:hypothetical protein
MARHLALLGDREAGRRRIRAAVGHWSKAADILDAVRAKLPPVDLRSAFLNNQSDPYRKLVEAEHQRDPLTAAVWSERFKTVGLWSTSEDVYLANPARRKAESSLSELAGQVTAVSQMISDKSRRRTPSALRQGDSFDRIQREVRRDLAALEKYDGGVSRVKELAAEFRRESNKQPIVQFHVGQKDIYAFIHHRGHCRAHRYIEGVATTRELVALWRFNVERAPSGRRISRADLKTENEILHRMGRWLLPPLELPSETDQLLILPEGQLASLPWPAMSQNGESVVDKCAISFAPSLRHYLHARKLKTRSTKASIFVGLSEDLTHLRDEVATVSSRLHGRDMTVFDPCRRADWPDHSSAKIWHFTGHAQLRSDNPFYSALLLADGPLFAADFRLKRNRVELITLAACRTGQQTSLPGEEAGGLVRSLLEMGAHNVIAGNWAVSDFSTTVWSDLLYKSYLSGSSAGQAVREAALGVREKFPSAYHWGAFSVFGAG